MAAKSETTGLIFGILSLVLFWVPPVGLALGIAGLATSLSHRRLNLRFGKAAVVISGLGIVVFVGFWASVWMLSQ